MRYHYVITVAAFASPGGQKVGMYADTVEVPEGDTRKNVFWKMFADACERTGIRPTEAYVMCWSLEPDALG